MALYCVAPNVRFYLFAVDVLYQHRDVPDFQIAMDRRALFCGHFAAICGLSRRRTTFRRKHLRGFIRRHHVPTRRWQKSNIH